MIRMIAGVYGLRVEMPDGRMKVVGMGPDSGPFSIPAEQEARLVEDGLAEYVPGEPVEDEEAQDGAPIGFDETPPEDASEESLDADEESSDIADEPVEDEGDTPAYEGMSAKELRELGAEYGLSFKANASKVSMIEAIKAQIAELDGDVEDAPAFDASEAVL